ncbi:Xaa-Pro peptidase family protein [Aureimonas sp. ME7]|uniref:M24 family metallopeptidase n=1 Tax=Aureimonas sp. ME7 TaxID=2744252 RepID=UPI0015F5FD6E|nr:Xaa-Pro peptidase family protein [Aureimonas sp. ME7]
MTLSPSPVPFDAAALDRLMEEAGLDVLFVTSKHNVQYLLGGYRFFMFDIMDATGLSRYLPIVVYPKGRPDLVAYVGNPNETFEHELGRLWPAHLRLRARGSVDAMHHGLDHLSKQGIRAESIGIEAGFLPADAFETLKRARPGARVADCVEVLESLRAVKTDVELHHLRTASERVVEAMRATFAWLEPGRTKREVVEFLRRQQTDRGLVFEYGLITAGKSFNRAPSDQRIGEGDILSLDSGGNYRGYIGDLCRMAVLGEPGAELEDALAFVGTVQQGARAPIRSGATGEDIFAAALPLTAGVREGRIGFVAHGMGLVSHEAPRLMDDGPIPYPARHRFHPLREGMVLSLETTWLHPRLGFLKLEDTVAVTSDGCEAYGDGARGWTRAGTPN